MKRRRNILLAVVAVSAAVGITGCSSDNAGYDDVGFVVQTVATPTGSVTCVLYDGFDGDAIDCDWAGVK